MKKLNQYSKSERVIVVISLIWLIIWFVIGLEETRGDSDEEFISIFLIFGVLPVIIVAGIEWIRGQQKKKANNAF